MYNLYVNDIFKEIYFRVIARQWFEVVQFGMVKLLNQTSKNLDKLVSGTL
jgi:hypothetical protein